MDRQRGLANTYNKPLNKMETTESRPKEKRGLMFVQAMEWLESGSKIKLPEWTGYWFIEDGEIKVMTKSGDILNTPWIEKYKDRVDWKITHGALGFDWAINALKNGKKVCRKGWNGKGMYLTLINAGNAVHQGFDMQDCIGMKTANNLMQPGWLASQNDMLATDWELAE